MPDLQMIKECKIHLGHLKTHRDTARRLRATVKRDVDQQTALQQQQATVAEEMRSCGPHAPPDCTQRPLRCKVGVPGGRGLHAFWPLHGTAPK